jgi:bifunctional UDP-N-acetylglucosamine pyrophosphorylase / glucosamine-1-phosphate N-acetyltransferase
VIPQESSVSATAGGPALAAVVVLAAGQGTRMRSSTPKVLHSLGGRSLLGHVLAAAAPLRAGATVVVVGSGRDAVEAHLAQIAPEALAVVQHEQNGSGHAAAVALAAVPDLDGPVLLVNGDAPLLRASTVTALVEAHRNAGNVLTVLTAEVDDPTGLGRIVRADDGAVRAIVEERDATDAQRAIREINAGVYVGDAAALRRSLASLEADNDQGEQYVTDVLGLLVAEGAPVGGVPAEDADDVLGCNDQRELAARRRTLNDRVLDDLMRAGVTVVDPLTTWVDVTVQLAPDVSLKPGVQLHGSTRVDTGAVIGPDTTLTDVEVGADSRVVRTHGSQAVLGPGSTVGPFAYLRPGTVLGPAGKIGTFVETKNAVIGTEAKVPHLSYVGDAEIGQGTNIGAGTIFANYDGVSKSRTTVGEQCRTGSQNVFVAPVVIGDGAATGAGTVVRRNVPPGALAVSSGPQRHIDGWVPRKRPGTAAARAAETALDEEASE